jgi:uncharacterized protein involved in response to NO
MATPAMPGLDKVLGWEPYRLMFTIGLLHVVGALALWVFAAMTGWLFKPGPAHIGLVVNGFMACFVAGFLGTFAPRLLDAPWTGPRATGSLVAVASAGLLAVILGSELALHLVHVVLYAWLLIFAARCLLQGGQRPPAHMAMAGMALVFGLVTALTMTLESAFDLPAVVSRTAWSLQTQGVLLIMVIGVGGLLVPRFAGGAGCSSGVGATPQPYLRYAALGVIVAASYGVEAWQFTQGQVDTVLYRSMFGLRALIAAALLVPAFRIPAGSAAWLRAAQCALGSIVLGLALPALWPGYLMAWNHLIFITGFLWLTLVIATKVVCAHSGRGVQLEQAKRSMIIMGSLLVIGMLTRIGAEWSPSSYNLHLWLGAVLVLAAIAWWMWRYALLLFVLPWNR